MKSKKNSQKLYKKCRFI